MYRLKRLPSPTLEPIVGMYIRGLKREETLRARPPRQSKPMTKEVLALMIQYLYEKPRSLRVWRTVWRVNVAFYALLRWDDICRLNVRMILPPYQRGNHFNLFYNSFPQVEDFQFGENNGEARYTFFLKGGKTVMHRRDPSR